MPAEESANLLHEWQAIMKRIESIDARLWQGAGILVAFSIGGLSFLGWLLLRTVTVHVAGLATSIVAVAILIIWWHIFHRWIYLQTVYSHRAREIERSLGLWFNRYARVVEHWETEEGQRIRDELRQHNEASCVELERFWEKYKKKRFIHQTIRGSLRGLTIVLLVAWSFVLVFSLSSLLSY